MDREVTTEILDILMEYEPYDIEIMMKRVVRKMDDDKLEGFRAKLKNYWVWEGSFTGENLLNMMEEEKERRVKDQEFLSLNPNTVVSSNTIMSNTISNMPVWYTDGSDSLNCGNEVFCQYDNTYQTFTFGDKAMASIIRNVSESLTSGCINVSNGMETVNEASMAYNKMSQKISSEVSSGMSCGAFDHELEEALERIKMTRPDLFV